MAEKAWRKASRGDLPDADDQKMLPGGYAKKYVAGEGNCSKGECHFSNKIRCVYAKQINEKRKEEGKVLRTKCNRGPLCKQCPHFERWQKGWDDEKRLRFQRNMQVERRVPWVDDKRAQLQFQPIDTVSSDVMFKKVRPRKLI